jgi:plastocyanin
MSKKRQIRMTFAVITIAVAGLLLPRMVSSREAARELRVTARGMTYYVDGVADQNPLLTFTPGEQVRVVFKNEDKGMAHNFSIPAWRVEMTVVQGTGEESLTFRVPTNASTAVYVCTPHAEMMSGRVAVQN